MKKDSYEKLDDGFINLYEEGLFVRCFEYSAVFVSEMTGYRLFVNIDKKTGFVFLECGFPKTKLQEIVFKIESKSYLIRLVDKSGNINSSIGTNKLEKNKEEIKQIKTNLINF